jgi:hypothetical protein
MLEVAPGKLKSFFSASGALSSLRPSSSDQLISLQIASMDLFAGWEQDRTTSAMAEQKFGRCVMKYATRFLMLTLTLLPMMAAAQMAGDNKIQAQVPFDFVIGSRSIPAGQLTVERATVGTLAMRNREAKVNLFAGVIRGETKKPAAANALVFHRYGHRYFLWQVKVEGSRTLYQLPVSGAEAELRAQNRQATEEVLLALK